MTTSTPLRLCFWMTGLVLFACGLDVNFQADSGHHRGQERSRERKLMEELGILNITDKTLIQNLGDVLSRRTDRSSETQYRIGAIALSLDEKAVYYAEKAAAKSNTTANGSTAVWKAEWADTLQDYNISHVAGPWPIRHPDLARVPNSTDVAGLLMLDDGHLLVSEKHNSRLQKLDVTTGREADSWTLPQPLGLAKHPDQDAIFASSGDRINKISLTVPSFWNAIGVIAGPTSNVSVRDYVDSNIPTEVRFRDPLIGPQSLSRDGGWLYVLDYWNNVVRRVNIPSGATTTIAGSKETMFGPDGGFNKSSMCIVTGNGCNLFVSGKGRLHWMTIQEPHGNVTSIKVVAELVLSDGSHGSIMAMSLTKDDQYLFAGTGDGRIFKLEVNVSALYQCAMLASPVDSKKKTSTNRAEVMLAVAVSLGCVIFILCAAGYVGYLIRGFRRHPHSSMMLVDTNTNTTRSSQTTTTAVSALTVPSSPDALCPASIKEFPLSTLETAISNGTSLDGKSGGYGDVYRAHLMVGSTMVDVAIKVMKGEFSVVKHKQFKAEVNTLSNVRHRNLCRLLGFCTEGNRFILVYPFISGGSLYDCLHGYQVTRSDSFREPETFDSVNVRKTPLLWTERMLVAKQIATCLRYLHHEADQPIVHRDVKSKNVLIEGRGRALHAYLSDFGLARPGTATHSDGTTSSGETTLCTMTRSGTPGYMPPEYVYESKLTMSSDVFAFGVLLLELVTGLGAVMKLNAEDSVPLYAWVKRHRRVDLLVDKTLRDALSPEEWAMADTIVRLAQRCTDDFASQRPPMNDVVQEIEAIIKTLQRFEEQEAPMGTSTLFQ